jgi:hypothetical protein
MNRRSYEYYAKQVFEQARHDPDVDDTSITAIVEYSDVIAELAMLDPEKLRAEVIRLGQIQVMKYF